MAQETQDQERLPAVRSLTPTEKHLAEGAGMKLRQMEDGSAVWAVQADLRQRYNVLAPISTVAQVDANWSPLPKIVIIEPGGYNTFKVGWDADTKSDLHSMQRVALDALAEASGINIHRQWTERFPGGFKVNVITRRRRADGLYDQRVRSAEVIYDDLAEEIEIGKLEKWERFNKEAWEAKQAGRPHREKDAKPPPSALEIRKEVLRERKFAPRKAETSAFGRCVRAHLGLPGAMPIKEYQKPFLCFTWSFTPDYSRVGTRELVRQLHGDAGDNLYGEEHNTYAIEDATVEHEELLPHELPDSSIDADTIEVDVETGEVVEREPEYDFEPGPNYEDPGPDEQPPDIDAWPEPPSGFNIAKRHPKYGGQHVREVLADGQEGWDLIANMARSTRVVAQRELCLEWLSWSAQEEVTLDSLAA